MNRIISVVTPLLFGLGSVSVSACMASEEPGNDAPPTPPSDEVGAVPRPPASHSGLVSVQDVRIANLPAAGHGLTVNVLLTPQVAPVYEERPGELEGCRVWRYDLGVEPAPPEQDHGTLDIAGLRNGSIRCTFVAQRGYVCPTAQGASELSVSAASVGQSRYSMAQGSFSSSDVGRYLSVQGGSDAANNGAFAIVAVPSSNEVVLANPRASSERFLANYTLLAGAGPTPGDLYSPFADGTPLTLAFDAASEAAFDSTEASLEPGAAFELDVASSQAIQHVPLDGSAFTLGCATCGAAQITILRLTTSDGDLTSLSPVAMPKAQRQVVELQCASLAAERIDVPAEALRILRDAHAASPMTRIRTAFMRDSFALRENAAPKPANRLVLVAGHGVIGFSQPQ